MLLKILPILLLHPVYDTVPSASSLQVQVKVIKPSCAGSCDGHVELEISGGQPGYTYKWSNGQTTAELSNVCAGSGDVTVRDAAGNATTAPYTVANPDPLEIINLRIKQPGVNLYDGGIKVEVFGGTMPYRYSLDGINFTPSNEFNGLGAGLYVVAVRDLKGCLFQTGTIVLQGPADVPDIRASYHLNEDKDTHVLHMYSSVPLEFELTDLQGRILHQEGLNRSHDIAMSELDYGVYFLEISDGLRTTFEKVVKARN